MRIAVCLFWVIAVWLTASGSVIELFDQAGWREILNVSPLTLVQPGGFTPPISQLGFSSSVGRGTAKTWEIIVSRCLPQRELISLGVRLTLLTDGSSSGT